MYPRNTYMSPKAIVNPDELRIFAQKLNQFNKEMAQNMSALQSQFVRLGDTWQDQEHQKFAREFEQTMRVLSQFQRTSEQQIPSLLKKARIIDDYLHSGT